MRKHKASTQIYKTCFFYFLLASNDQRYYFTMEEMIVCSGVSKRSSKVSLGFCFLVTELDPSAIGHCGFKSVITLAWNSGMELGLGWVDHTRHCNLFFW